MAVYFPVSGKALVVFSARIAFPLVIFAFFTACSLTPQESVNHPLPALKILVETPGVYQIDGRDLEELGWDLEGVDFDHIQILWRGHEQPFWAQGQGRDLKIRFYAQKTHSRYTRQNVYWLVDKSFSEEIAAKSAPLEQWDTAESRPESLVVGSPVQSNTYIASLQLEENTVYAPQVDDFDTWFWLTMPATYSQEFEFELRDVAPGPGSVTVEVWAATHASESPDHHLRLILNEHRIADQFWDGKGLKIIQAQVPDGILKSGINHLQIESPGDTGVAADIVLLNRIVFSFTRYTIAQDGRLAFTGSGDKKILSGFSGSVDGYDVTDPISAFPIELVAKDDSTLELESQIDHQYLIVGPEGVLEPHAFLESFLSPNLSAPDQVGDYVAIGPRDLLEPLQPLLDHRAGQGLEVAAIPIEAIYDQFNHGFPEPQAISKFLRYASQNWQVGPRYVLLVGDSSYDPRGYLGQSEANRLPAYFVHTDYGGETVSDVIFARLDEDAWPDIALGRLPAQTPQQVEIWVRKLLEYEQASRAEDWSQRILAVADGQQPSFQRDAQSFLDRFPGAFQKSLVNPAAGATGAHLEIRERIDSGNLVVAYFGHGSVQMWGKDRLFTTEDVAELSNQGRYPLVVNMTCLTGLFTHPNVESLAEAFLWHHNGGAIAVLAPTSLTLPTDQSFLSNALVDALISDPDQAIGEALLAARRQVPANIAAVRDVMDTFLLFGDPAMVLR